MTTIKALETDRRHGLWKQLKEYLKRVGVRKLLSTSGAKKFLRGLMRVKRLSRQHTIRRYFKAHATRKLHIGCGNNTFEGWLNADYQTFKKNVVYMDAKRPLPFKDNVLDYIYSEHMIEHIDYLEGLDMLKECFRVLKPGGKIRIATPDLERVVDFHRLDKAPIQEQYIEWVTNQHMPHLGMYVDTFVINNFFYNYGHKFIYDYKILKDSMQKAGFGEVKRCHSGVSSDGDLCDLEGRRITVPKELNRFETFVVEGVKHYPSDP